MACAFNEHKIIALPTDTVYGVGVKYGNLDDLERLKRAKHRPETKPIPMMVSNVEQMKQVALVDERIEKIAAKLFARRINFSCQCKRKCRSSVYKWPKYDCDSYSRCKNLS